MALSSNIAAQTTVNNRRTINKNGQLVRSNPIIRLNVIKRHHINLKRHGDRLIVHAFKAVKPRRNIIIQRNLTVSRHLYGITPLNRLNLGPLKIRVTPRTNSRLILLTPPRMRGALNIRLTRVTTNPPLLNVYDLPRMTRGRQTTSRRFAVFNRTSLCVQRQTPRTTKTVYVKPIRTCRQYALERTMTFMSQRASPLYAVRRYPKRSHPTSNNGP